MRVYPSLRILLRWRVNIRQVPSILERCACRFATDGCGVISVGVEGRIEVDEVDAVVVDSAHDIEVVALEDGSVGDVAGGGLCLTCGHRVQCTPECCCLNRGGGGYERCRIAKSRKHPLSPLTLREGGERFLAALGMTWVALV